MHESTSDSALDVTFESRSEERDKKPKFLSTKSVFLTSTGPMKGRFWLLSGRELIIDLNFGLSSVHTLVH